MNIPDNIKIGGQWWYVEFRSCMDNSGECHKDKQIILINADHPRAEQESTFLHEVLHACCDFMGLQEDEKLGEEEIVSRLTPILYTVLKENEL